MSRSTYIPLVATLLVAVPCAAQTKPIEDEVKANLESQRQAQLTKQADAERAEDVEILRRILNHSLGLPIHATTSTPTFPMNGMGGGVPNSFVPHNWNNGAGWSGPSFPQPGLNNLYTVYATQTTPVGPFDGVSLTGYGVIYTLRIPEHTSLVLDPPAKSVGLAETCRKCHGTEPVSRDALEPTGDKASPPTEWDRTRQELHGAKQSANQPPAAARLTRQQICKPGNMTERIVEKLWQNMQHVRHLAPTDRVTVAITFDGLTGSGRVVTHTSRVNKDAPAVQAEIATESSGDRIAGFTNEEAAFIRDGDKLMREGKAAGAVTAYLTALGQVGHSGPVRLPVTKAKLDDWKHHVPDAFKNINRGVLDVRRKLANAIVAVGTDRAILKPAPATPIRPAPRTSSDWPKFKPDEVKQLALGDLHLKQGNPKEAVKAYEQVLARFNYGLGVRIAPPAGLTSIQCDELAAELQKNIRDAYRRLAQAYLAAGDVENGQIALYAARKYTVRPVSANDGDKRVPVPAKLLISVTRADADKAGDSLPNFRKAVKVETIGFPPADRAKK